MQPAIAPTLTLQKDRKEMPVLDSERIFYEQHAWCVNAFPTIREVITHLCDELNELRLTEENWRKAERLTNVFLLSCAISDTVDDYLAGTQYDFSQATGVFGPSRLIVRPLTRSLRFASHVRATLLNGLSCWRHDWESALGRFMAAFASGSGVTAVVADLAYACLLPLLDYRLPADLLSTRARIPAAFRSQDLTHFDVFALGRKFIHAYADRTRPILVAGLRTAGSFLCAIAQRILGIPGIRACREPDATP